MTSVLAQDVLDGLGPAFAKNAGDLLGPLVDGLVAPSAETASLMTPAPGGWATAFCVDTTTRPAWLAQLVGAPDRSLTVEEQRAAIVNRTGWRTGTLVGLTRTLQQALIGLRRVIIAERDSSPWHATISIYESDFADGTTQALIESLAERHRPAGVSFDFVFYPAFSYQEAEFDAGTYETAEATATTYADTEE